MAFQNLKTGSKIYVFHKTDDPKLEIGVVVGDIEIVDKFPMPSQQSPYPNFQAFPAAPQTKEKEVKLTAKLEDGRVVPISKLNPTGDIEDCGNGILVSCSKEAINAEMVAHKQNSDMALDENTLNIHRRISKNCEYEMSRLNPEIAERQAAEKEKREMKQELDNMKQEIGAMSQMMRSLLDQLGGPQNN